MSQHILIIDDDRDLATLLRSHLEELAYGLEVAHIGADARRLLDRQTFDLIVLDLTLPDTDGLELCRYVRSRPPYPPILMLTAKTSELDRVVGLEIGADDYVTKPFSLRELLARVKAILRRSRQVSTESGEAALLRRGDLVIDPGRRSVLLEDTPLDLTPKEYDLLILFARHPGKVYTRSQLLDQVWGYRYDGYEHTVNSHINRLRAKIEPDAAEHRYIRTVWGVGYKFMDTPDHPP
jgi:DNA-binding response OmpR family regulator